MEKVQFAIHREWLQTRNNTISEGLVGHAATMPVGDKMIFWILTMHSVSNLISSYLQI